MISLIELLGEKEAKVISIEGGHGVMRKLYHLGIREGIMIKKVTKTDQSGPVVIKIGHSKVALGRGMAQKIIVEPLEIDHRP